MSGSGVLRYSGEVIEDLAANPGAVIPSLTVQPLSGLEGALVHAVRATLIARFVPFPSMAT